jgi:preprotein translocase subunit SecA
MNLENEMFQKDVPSFESVLYWIDKKDQAKDIADMIRMYRNELERDEESFYEFQYDFCKRAISLLIHYKDDSAYEDVFYIYEVLYSDEDEVLLGTCESYLRDLSSEKQQAFVKTQWERLLTEWDDESDILFMVFSFLIRSGYREDEIHKYVKKILWSDNDFAKIMIVSDIDCISFSKEIERRLKYIAPMIKYGPKGRGDNFYMNEWIEMADPYLKLCKGIDLDEYYKHESIKRSEDDSFLLLVLGWEDDRVREVNEKYISETMSEEYFKKAKEEVEKRDQLMSEHLLDKLPDSLDEWVLSPFIDRAQRAEMEGFIHDIELSNRVATDHKKVKVGRNDPCLCGSGKKYKKCCLK